MNQFDSVNNLISRMEAYIINKQIKGSGQGYEEGYELGEGIHGKRH